MSLNLLVVLWGQPKGLMMEQASSTLSPMLLHMHWASPAETRNLEKGSPGQSLAVPSTLA